MSRLPFRLLVIALTLAIPPARVTELFAQQGPKPSRQISSLVEQLGNEDFAVRENASRKLLLAGMEAIDALSKGSRDPDREVRYRCLRIMRLIKENDFRRRLQQFAKGDLPETPLPGWEKFEKLLGNSSETRDLFVDMQRAEPELMIAVDQGAASTTNALTLRTQKLDVANRIYRYRLTTGDIGALLFAAGDERVEVPSAATSTINRFCTIHGFASSASLGSHKQLMRQLLGRWVLRGEGWSAYRAMELARKFGLTEGLAPAESILRSDMNQTNAKQYAILTIAKLGDKNQVPLLRSLLDDPTVCSTQRFQRNKENVQLQGQLRDVALAGLLHLLDQDPLDFGFDRKLATHSETVFQVNTIGFINQQQRAAAFKKWEAFEGNAAKPTPAK
jgi:hypothetical protein